MRCQSGMNSKNSMRLLLSFGWPGLAWHGLAWLGQSHTEERKLQTLWLLSVFGQSFRINVGDLVSRKTLPFEAFWPRLWKPVSSASHGPSKDKRSPDRWLIDDLLRYGQKTFFALNDRETEMKIEQKFIWLIVWAHTQRQKKTKQMQLKMATP